MPSKFVALAALAVAAAPAAVQGFSPSVQVGRGLYASPHKIAGSARMPLRPAHVAARAPKCLLHMQEAPQTPKAESKDELPDDVFQTALRETGVAVGAATLFGVGIGSFLGTDKAIEYFTGYLLEESLSVDNLFVFLLLFDYFQVPNKEQKKVLQYGIWGAVLMRAAFIGAGLLAIEKFRGVLVGFAALLLYSSYQILSGAGDDDEEEEDLSENQVVKLVGKFVKSSATYDGDKFFTVVDGVKMATPLLVVLICVELSDVIFAVDSIPAVFGVTEDPLIVFTSNIFAIASLRALYQVLAKLAQDLKYLDTAVGGVLGFIGLKLIAEYLGYEVSEIASLGVVGSMLGVGVGTSLQARRALNNQD